MDICFNHKAIVRTLWTKQQEKMSMSCVVGVRVDWELQERCMSIGQIWSILCLACDVSIASLCSCLSMCMQWTDVILVEDVLCWWVSVYQCVCVCVCISIELPSLWKGFVCVCMCVCVCVCAHACVCVCVCVYLYVCVWQRERERVFNVHALNCHPCGRGVYVCVCVCMHMHVFVCVRITTVSITVYYQVLHVITSDTRQELYPLTTHFYTPQWPQNCNLQCVFVCVCVFACTCVCACMCVCDMHVFVYVYVCVQASASLCVCTFVHVTCALCNICVIVCMLVCMCVHVSLILCVCVCVCACVCVCVCVRILKTFLVLLQWAFQRPSTQDQYICHASALL